METRSNHVLVGGVVLALLALLAFFTIWIARLGTAEERNYDIFFKQSVEGLAKGSAITYKGVPAGQVKQISLWKNDPEYVRVRITVTGDTQILVGTTATILGSFTGTSTISLDGGTKGAAPLTCPAVNADAVCPYGVPVIPPKPGGLGALLNSAPQLLERLSTLTERLTGLLTDRNQASIAGILANTNRLSGALADRGPEIAATLAQTRIAIQQAGDAAAKIGTLAESSNGVITDARPAMENLNTALIAAQHSADALTGTINAAKPGLQSFSSTTIPEANKLIRDLRATSAALSSVAGKIDSGGATSLIGSPKLPDYKGK